MLAGQMAMAHPMAMRIDPFHWFHFTQRDRNAALFGSTACGPHARCLTFVQYICRLSVCLAQTFLIAISSILRCGMWDR
jgi:hypothetical protein